MSKNWLAKFNVFPGLVESNGFNNVSKEPRMGDWDKRMWAILTMSSSYLLVGSGAINPESQGAPLIYSHLPLRKNLVDVAEKIVYPHTHFRGLPIINTPVGIVGGPIENTSPAVQIYTRIDENAAQEDMGAIGRSLDQSFIDIDHQSICGRLE